MGKLLLKKYFPIVVVVFTAILCLIKIDTIWGFISNILLRLTPLWLSIILFYIFDRPIKGTRSLLEHIPFLKKSKATPYLAVFLVFLLFIGLLTLVVVSIIPSFQNSLTDFFNNLDYYLRSPYRWIDQLSEYLDKRDLDSSITTNLKEALNQFGRDIGTHGLGFARNLISNVVSGIGTFVMSLILSIYILSGKSRIRNQLKRFFSAISGKYREQTIHVLRLFDKTCYDYFFVQITEGLILGGLCFIAFSLFQIPYAIILSVLIALCALIPAVGAWLAGGLGTILILLVDVKKTPVFLLVYLITQQIEGNFIYPRRVTTMIGLPGLIVMLAVLVGAGIGGIAGAIMSVPIASTLYQLCKEWVRNKELEEDLALDPVQFDLRGNDRLDK